MDTQLYYVQTGIGFPLVLLHGNGEDHTYFAAQMNTFAARHRVLAIDTRGHGQSPRGTAPFTLAQFADDLCFTLDTLDIPQADILGYSDGGNIALLFALRYPHRVRRLVVNGANLSPTGLKPATLLFIALRYALYSILAPVSPKTARKRALYGLMVKEPHISPAALHALAIPTLVLAGTRDVVRARHTRRIATSLPHGQLLFLHGGHAIAQEQPTAYATAVLYFLEN